ncbi:MULTISPECIES: hypothetical protein [Paenibacillus]|uniref:hypothetical protein n=1 Tax=Paenibacillus TaxID=44249 RepID=UPI00123AE01E|nr:MULTISPECIES: hypothetical protein [Paenibacillus]KAA8747307.1 hypothetical protein FE296_24360 [Paenibacillus sp. UASWS1643]MCF7756148.1 hypothetical protein [Paenibacillus xylanexedens]
MPTLDNYSLGNYGLGGCDKDAPMTLLFQSGDVASSSSTLSSLSFDQPQFAGPNFYYISATNTTGVIPKMIIVRRGIGTTTTSVFLRDVKNASGYSLCFCSASGGNFISISTTFTGFFVTSSSIRLPVAINDTNYRWEAWG